jgi:hypothetical protein
VEAHVSVRKQSVGVVAVPLVLHLLQFQIDPFEFLSDEHSDGAELADHY